MSLLLEVINASWRPRGGPDIVSNISFTVPAGRTLAICGPNGSGKSTLLRMLYRFQRPTAGRVLVGGQDLWQMQPRQAACLVAAVLQEQPTDFALNVTEMVMLGRNPHRQGFAAPDKTDRMIVEEALAALELTEFAGQPFGRLSGGERQRVMVARALAQRPQVLILDEPTNHLDIRHQLEVLSLVRNLDCTVICTLHDLTLASEYADLALVLSRGKMVSLGEPKGVLTAPLIKQTYNVTAQIDRANGASRFSYHLKNQQSELPVKTRMKFAVSVAALLLSPVSAFAAPVTVKSCNRDVTFAEPPKRAISNDVNLTEMMLVLGLRDRMVGYTGISGWKTLDAEMREGVAELPELSAKYPTKEVLVGADADFFFAGWNYGLKVGGEVTPDTMEPLGIAIYELTESCIHIGAKAKVSMDDMYVDLINLGKIFGVSDRATALVEGYKAKLAEVTANVDRSKPLRVFVYDSGEKAPFTAGKYAMPTAMIEAAGGVNIMDDLEKSWAEIAWEPVVERNPEVIMIVNYGDVTAEQKIEFMKSNPAFASIDAVKNNRFVVLEYVEATPGPRNIQAVEKLVAGFAAK